MEKIVFTKDEKELILKFLEKEEIEKILLKRVGYRKNQNNIDIIDEVYCDTKKLLNRKVIKYLELIDIDEIDNEFFICYFNSKKENFYRIEEFELNKLLKDFIGFNLNSIRMYKYRKLNKIERERIFDSVIKLKENTLKNTSFGELNQKNIDIANQQCNFLKKYKKEINEIFEQDLKIEELKERIEEELKNNVEDQFIVFLIKFYIEVSKKESYNNLDLKKTYIKFLIKQKKIVEIMQKYPIYWLEDNNSKFIFLYLSLLKKIRNKRKEKNIKLEEFLPNQSKYLNCGEWIVKNKIETYLEKLYPKIENEMEKNMLLSEFEILQKLKKEIKENKSELDTLSKEIKFIFKINSKKDQYPTFLNSFIEKVEISSDFLASNDELNLINNELYFIRTKEKGDFLGSYCEIFSDPCREIYMFQNEIIQEKNLRFVRDEIDILEKIISLKIKRI